jgi:hypothetical protein
MLGPLLCSRWAIALLLLLLLLLQGGIHSDADNDCTLAGCNGAGKSGRILKQQQQLGSKGTNSFVLAHTFTHFAAALCA